MIISIIEANCFKGTTRAKLYMSCIYGEVKIAMPRVLARGQLAREPSGPMVIQLARVPSCPQDLRVPSGPRVT